MSDEQSKFKIHVVEDGLEDSVARLRAKVPDLTKVVDEIFGPAEQPPTVAEQQPEDSPSGSLEHLQKLIEQFNQIDRELADQIARF